MTPGAGPQPVGLRWMPLGVSTTVLLIASLTAVQRVDDIALSTALVCLMVATVVALVCLLESTTPRWPAVVVVLGAAPMIHVALREVPLRQVLQLDGVALVAALAALGTIASAIAVMRSKPVDPPPDPVARAVVQPRSTE